MNIRLLQIIILISTIAQLHTQQKTSIKPLPSARSRAELKQDQPVVNPEYERVVKEYEKLIRKYPEKKELFYNLGNLNYINRDLESALKNYRKAVLNDDPKKKAHALYNMGNLYNDQGDLQKSVKLFKEALKLAPDDEDIRHNFELSKLMLEQQPSQQDKDQNKDGETQLMRGSRAAHTLVWGRQRAETRWWWRCSWRPRRTPRSRIMMDTPPAGWEPVRRGEPSLAAVYEGHHELQEMLKKAEAEWKGTSVSLLLPCSSDYWNC